MEHRKGGVQTLYTGKGLSVQRELGVRGPVALLVGNNACLSAGLRTAQSRVRELSVRGDGGGGFRGSIAGLGFVCSGTHQG